MTAEARRVDRALPGWLAVVLVVVSSAAVLVLEITSLRLIAPYVGITVETNTGVIGLALAAIALGSWAGGAAADRRPPRAMIGPLLVVGGALVLVVTPAVRLAAAAVGPSDAPSVALLLAGVTVFAPAAVLSAVSPMVVKLQLASLDDTGSVVGRLSSIGTLGAILATFLTGFVLVAVVPTSVILLATGALLVVGGAALVVLARRDGIRTRPVRRRRSPSRSSPRWAAWPSPRRATSRRPTTARRCAPTRRDPVGRCSCSTR